MKDEYHPFIKPGKRCVCGRESANATVWLFAGSLVGRKFARDGMPAGKWVWQCNIVRESAEVLTIAAVKERHPIGSLLPLVEKARGLGCKQLRWERVDEDGETRVIVHDITNGMITDEPKPPKIQPRHIALVLIPLVLWLTYEVLK